MKKIRNKILLAVIALVILFVYYYFALPAINIHAVGFWQTVIFILAVVTVLYGVRIGIRKPNIQELKRSKGLLAGIGLIVLVVAIFAIGSLLSSPIINAKKYQKILSVEERNFSDDIEEVSFDKIPLLDRDSAELLGNRKMGSMVDMVSQYEVSSLYTQINYQGTPVRVTPLCYANTIKWLTNQKTGLPAYIKIDMATQNVECVKLSEGMKYSPYDHFNRNLYRHLRFSYPTYIFDDFNFEIDEDGVPYWICPVKKYTIGLFGGQTIGRVVLCNAITGELQDYPVEEVPSWVDRVYSPELLISYYDYYGTLKHGYFNSVLGQKDCLQTTNGYNYVAMQDDVWVYTGITSVSGDQSNVGFVLMNQRTMETRFYSVEGAIEDSAMSSAEGQVQNLGYVATFPLLLNIADEPTYFIALKDDAGLVKKYAMVNVQKYQIVAIGDTVASCEEAYISLLHTNGLKKEEKVETQTTTVTGVVDKSAQAVIDGNSHFYLLLQGSQEIYDVSVADTLQVLYVQEGDTVTLEYETKEDVNHVVSLKKEQITE